jgi:hypothetical protein
MPVNIVAVVTDIGRQRLLDGWGQVTALTSITSFKVGEGGWEQTPAGRVPRDPTDPGPTNSRGPTLTDLDAISNPADYPADSLGTFQKALVSVDFSITGNSTLEVTCVVAVGDFIDDGNGNTPEIYEIGLFNSAGEMVAYGTYPVVLTVPGPNTFTVKILAERS